MLLLSRKAGEEIVVGGDIVITITRIGSGRVSIGIEAPREVSIVRGELDPLPRAPKLPVRPLLRRGGEHLESASSASWNEGEIGPVIDQLSAHASEVV